MQVTIQSSKQVWKSPDGQRVLFTVETDRGAFKCYSGQIAGATGQTMEVEAYEREGKYGPEKFIRGVKSEEYRGSPQGATSAPRTSTDENIRKSVALKAAIEWGVGHKLDLMTMFAVADDCDKWLQGQNPVADDLPFD